MEVIANEGVVRLINEVGESVIAGDAELVPFYSEILNDREDGVSLVAPDDGFLLTDAVLCARDSADENGTFVQIKSRWKK